MTRPKFLLPIFVIVFIVTAVILLAETFGIFRFSDFVSLYSFLFLGLSVFGTAYIYIPFPNFNRNSN